jgi:hypothetical protein
MSLQSKGIGPYMLGTGPRFRNHCINVVVFQYVGSGGRRGSSYNDEEVN